MRTWRWQNVCRAFSYVEFGNRWIALLRVPSGAVRGRHDPPSVDERSPAEDEHGLGRGFRGQSHLPRDLALVRVLAAHHAGVAQGRATAN